jgi:hypothetical protein
VTEEIRRLQKALPFEPFTVITSGGNRYRVASPKHMHIHPQGTQLRIWIDGGGITFASRNVASIGIDATSGSELAD